MKSLNTGERKERRFEIGYKINDYEGETVADDFNTATDAYTCMSKLFTKEHIKNMSLRVVKQEDNNNGTC